MKPTYALPFWMNGPRAQSLVRTSKRWWELAESYIRLPLTTFDVLTCELGFVDLIAYQRGIDRYAGESEHFYRLRVHHALRNAQVAGTPVGMAQIFSNLELPTPTFKERMPNRDWDMTRVTFSGRDYARLHVEIDFILRAYWRTCRRFEIVQEIHASGVLMLALYGYNRAYNRLEGKVKSVPIRPSQNTVGMAVYGSNRTLQTAASEMQPVPFRHAMHQLQVVPFRHAMHRLQPLPTRKSQNNVVVGSFAYCRSVNVRSFAA